MLRDISDLKRFTIAGTDGNLGSMTDLYFDDRNWAVRYLVVDAGNWLQGRRVLVPPPLVRSSDPTTIRVALSKKQVEIGSEVSTIQVGPVNSAPQDGFGAVAVPRARDGEDVHLQPATAVLGYSIRAEDGEIGHVKDVLVDDKAWAIRYLVIDTENWWSGKKVLVSPGWLTGATWGESKTLFCIATAIDDWGISR
jgi:sporulation protein YlmC with PRC-barrel domain